MNSLLAKHSRTKAAGEAASGTRGPVRNSTSANGWHRLDRQGLKALPRQRPHHLIKALAMLGLNVSFVEDREQKIPAVECGGRLEVLGRDALVYASKAIYFVYYAYHVWTLGEAGERWLETLQPEDRLRLETLRTNHALEDTKVWFDLIDDPSLHNDHIYASAVNLFIQHADYVTTSSRILKRRYNPLGPISSWSRMPAGPPILTAKMIPSRLPFGAVKALKTLRADGQRVIGYVGAVAAWFDFSLLEQLVRERPFDQFLIVGPIAEDVAEEVNRLRRWPNVAFTGAVPYDTVPSILSRLDVAILPFVANAITDATNPLKLYEYSRSGYTRG